MKNYKIAQGDSRTIYQIVKALQFQFWHCERSYNLKVQFNGTNTGADMKCI